MSTIGFLHDKLVFSRRVQVLAEAIMEVLPNEGAVLDVGCGDGLIDHLIKQQRPGLSIVGVDILVRPQTHIPVDVFDGSHLPFEDKSFDIVLFTDVLHHTVDPELLLREAKRVARAAIILKDHTQEGIFAASTLRFMDWIGNAHHGVVLPYNYWKESRWHEAFGSIGLQVQSWRPELWLYPKPASWLFDRKLHFVARLGV
jgi:SAM-dependent methyltransferase